MLHLLGGPVDSSPCRALNWFIFLLRHSGSKSGTQMMQESDLCPIILQNFQIVFCQMRRAAIILWRVAV